MKQGRPKIDYRFQDVIDKALEYTSEITGIKTQDIQCKCKKATFVRARFIYEYVMMETTPLTMEEIGRNIYRDHATVWSGYCRAKELFALNKEFLMQALTVQDMLEEYIDNRENILNFKTL